MALKSPKWFNWIGEAGGRLSDPLAAPARCGGCGRSLRAGGRFCAGCGKPAFPVSASEELALPAGRTVPLAAGMLLARFDPFSADVRWRDQPGDKPVKTDGGIRLALVVVAPGGGREQVVAVRPLVAWTHNVAWGPTFELMPLEVEAESLRLLVRRTG